MLIGFAGDTMLGRLVNEKIDQTDYAYPWGNMLPLLEQNDLNIINLETTLTHSQEKIPKVFNFKATPDKVKSLLLGNIHVCNLANNHILDFGPIGLLETIETLNKADIKHMGAGATIQQAKQPVIITKDDITLGIIGFSDNHPEWQATEDRAGVNYVHVTDSATAQKQIKALKDKVDLVVMSIHWGPNMRERPPASFITFAHAMIDAGVDIFHGHSAHIFQGIEVYKNKLIMYDTGDFVDDYMVDPTLRNDHSFLFQVTIDTDGIQKIQLIPTLISNMQVNHATGHDLAWSIKRMQELSAAFGTKISDDGVVTLHT